MERNWEMLKLGPNYNLIKKSTWDTLQRYVEQRIPTGGFLYAVLTNDLFEAMGKADEKNRVALHQICMLVYNELPSVCWRTHEKVEEWLNGEERV